MIILILFLIFFHILNILKKDEINNKKYIKIKYSMNFYKIIKEIL